MKLRFKMSPAIGSHVFVQGNQWTDSWSIVNLVVLYYKICIAAYRLVHPYLRHRDLNKMADIYADDILDCILSQETIVFD